MTDNRQDVAKREGAEAQRREAEIVLRPPVDVSEDTDGITLLLDMPGVAKERLNVQADQNTLLVEGTIEIPVAERMEALLADVQSTRYRRSFTLSSELEADKTEAGLKDGVLTIRIPKRAELRPRKVEIRAG